MTEGVNVYEHTMCFFLYIFRNLLMVRFIKTDIKMLMAKTSFLKKKNMQEYLLLRWQSSSFYCQFKFISYNNTLLMLL